MLRLGFGRAAMRTFARFAFYALAPAGRGRGYAYGVDAKNAETAKDRKED